MINVERLRAEYSKLEEKLSQIADVPKLHGTGYSVSSIEFDENRILCTVITSSDCEYLSVKWDEINNPIEYFEQKYTKEIEDARIAAETRKQKELEDKEARELAEYQRLQNKFGNK